MSTTVRFAGNLTDDPGLGYTRGGGKPYVRLRVIVNHRFQNVEGEWQDEGPTAHDVRVYGGAAINVADSFGSGDPVTVHGRLKTEALDRQGDRREAQQAGRRGQRPPRLRRWLGDQVGGGADRVDVPVLVNAAVGLSGG